MSQSQSYRPASPGSQISRPMSAMSKDPEDYIDAHRALSINRDESRRRRSFHAIGPSNTKMSLQEDKQTVFQKLKAFFVKDKLGEGEEERGRDAMRGRTRSRSVTRFLGMGRREDD